MRLAAFAWVTAGVSILVACASGESDGGGGGKGGSGNVGGKVGGGGGGSGGGVGASGGAAGSGGTGGGVAGSTSGGGTAGSGTGGTGWPTCDTQPTGVPTKTIPEIWADNPSTETSVWVPGVYVTAMSGAGCSAGTTCQIFVQQDETYATLAAGSKHGIKIRVSANVAQYFTGIKVGDQIDVQGYAWRFDLFGNNEMVVQVNSTLPGCAKKIGTGNPTPIVGVQLTDLSVNGYEQTNGPLLVQVSTVTGKPAAPGEIFGLWKTGVGIGDAGPLGIPSASPFFLTGGSFTGLPTDGQTAVNFQTITGVSALFIPSEDGGTPPKYVVLYPRTMSDLVQ